MTTAPSRPGPLVISKYSNRRFYDTSRSCNVTLEDLHGLIADGWDLKISDSKTGEDLTNAVLTQLILEHHAAKLAIFPPAILHQVIRTQQQFLGGVVEQFFRQTLEAQRATQEQWSRFMQNTLGVAAPAFPAAPSPVDWTRSFFDALGGGTRGASPSAMPDAGSVGESAAAASVEGSARPSPDSMDELRRQLAELTRRIDAVANERQRSSPDA